MARSIYATFSTEKDAERATGALLDHGVAAEDVSFVISDPTLHPTVFHPTSSEAPHGAPPADVVPPAPIPLPGTYASTPGAQPGSPPYAQEDRVPASTAPVVVDTAEIRASTPTGAVYSHPVHTVHATTLAPNTPQEIVEHENRPHIIDMESTRPEAADGISTTTAGDALKGAAGGAGVGIGLGILLGIAAMMVPGVGLVAGTGALVAGLAAATGVAGGIAGGVIGYLTDLGVPSHHARLLSDHLNSGGVVLHVEVSGSVSEEEIIAILTKYRATSAEGF